MHLHKWAPWTEYVREKCARGRTFIWQTKTCTICHKTRKRNLQ